MNHTYNKTMDIDITTVESMEVESKESESKKSTITNHTYSFLSTKYPSTINMFALPIPKYITSSAIPISKKI